MNKYTLKVTNRPLEVGWRAELAVQFEPLAEATEEAFWVRVEDVHQNGHGPRYVGVVEDYLTYSQAHGLKKGFMIEFGQENVREAVTA